MASLDMSLDDMIKNRRSTGRGDRGRGQPRRGRGRAGLSRGGRLFGAPHRNTLGVNPRPSPYTIAKSIRRTKSLPWHNGLFEESLKAAGLSGVLETGTKLYISNLDVGVSNEDIRELFSEIGELIRFAIHYDKHGRPSGSAEVIFARRSDAFQAFKRYNNVQLDGRPMKIEVIGANPEVPVTARVNVVGGTNGRKRTVVMGSGPVRTRGGFTSANRGMGARGRGMVRGRGGRGGGRGNFGGRGGGRGGGAGGGVWKKKSEKSAAELDKELESYHADAMQT
ncbi:THO complex subunit 4D-like [Andrographis paniculata]|uniref:THO complex subunit 4D-like n=1 Tax=Andrographis paniculata TaxID=175694 RepID=UPI0021E938A6|nr:THO complex subunit 4D-like [Andrographis paniculata]